MNIAVATGSDQMNRSASLGIYSSMRSVRVRAKDAFFGGIERRLDNGQRALRCIRFCVGVTMLTTALVCWASYAILYDGHWSQCNQTINDHVLTVIMTFLFYGRFVALYLAPLADDIWFARLVLGIDCLVAVSSDWEDMQDFYSHESYNMLSRAFILSDLPVTGVFVCSAVWAMCHTQAEGILKRMWCCLSIWLAIIIFVETFFAFASSVRCGEFLSCWWWVLSAMFTLYFVQQKDMRQLCHAKLNRYFETYSARRSAAGIAGLVGRCSARQALLEASKRFRSVSLNEVRFADMADNVPNPELFARTCDAWAEGCDAFVSHSWHDDAEAKWTSLQRWRVDFVAKHSREPTVWLDKFCINQTNIEDDLRCLPIFLSRCRRMVVLCGPTYLNRLWCIIELFAYVHMGRNVDTIVLESVHRQGHENEDMRSIELAFDLFDAHLCTCFAAEERERIVNIIHAAFGSVASFNLAIQDIFQRVGWRRSSVPDICASPDVEADSDSDSVDGDSASDSS